MRVRVRGKKRGVRPKLVLSIRSAVLYSKLVLEAMNESINRVSHSQAGWLDGKAASAVQQ